MATQRLSGLYPSNPNASKQGTRLVVTRKRAQQLVDILKSEFNYESSYIVPSIEYELAHGTHDTHISFVIDENDMDGYTAFTYACVLSTVNYQEIGYDYNKK